jgi:hypothetical protein
MRWVIRSLGAPSCPSPGRSLSTQHISSNQRNQQHTQFVRLCQAYNILVQTTPQCRSLLHTLPPAHLPALAHGCARRLPIIPYRPKFVYAPKCFRKSLLYFGIRKLMRIAQASIFVVPYFIRTKDWPVLYSTPGQSQDQGRVLCVVYLLRIFVTKHLFQPLYSAQQQFN